MSEEKAKPKNWFMKHKIITIILVLVILFIIGSIFGGNNGTSQVSDLRTNSNEPQKEVVAPIQITSIQLSEEYDANKVAADAKYKGKILEVTGIIDNIGKDILDDPYVVLKGTPTKLFGIQCMFKKSDEQKLINLSKGSEITLTGKVSGELIGNVILRECNF